MSAYWFDVGPIGEIPPRGARVVRTPRRDIAVFRTVNDEVFALDDRCPQAFLRADPGSEFTSCPAAEDKDIEPFDFTHNNWSSSRNLVARLLFWTTD
jgi:hypothetical protein